VLCSAVLLTTAKGKNYTKNPPVASRVSPIPNIPNLYSTSIRPIQSAPPGVAVNMQKVTAILPSWDKTKTTSKTGFDKGWKLLGMSCLWRSSLFSSWHKGS